MSKSRVLVDLPDDLLEWFTAEGELRDRSRMWMIANACAIYRDRLEAQRQRRAARAGQRLATLQGSAGARPGSESQPKRIRDQRR